MTVLLILSGNLTADPQMKYLESGDAITNFSIGSSERWTDGHGQRQKRTTWFRIGVYGKTAEACNEYLKKGSKVLVVGKLVPDPKTGNPRIWNKADGTPAADYEVRASSVEFLDRKEREDEETTLIRRTPATVSAPSAPVAELPIEEAPPLVF